MSPSHQASKHTTFQIESTFSEEEIVDILADAFRKYHTLGDSADIQVSFVHSQGLLKEAVVSYKKETYKEVSPDGLLREP